ncbi:diacylglycerol kinase [Falsochrobactrum sp. TDYN1]|uniref:Diacylglycerol kinase n=1 Tax=Falsochrobactrum tianjinense TaxID=2706015 RepID=A0A949PNF1_9HYPH|nr:diacylglycerol kinase [Falsochrobactrum sp. TDYN1]MBV2144472.1 diacylglycerol kinase [Falsochrobactrum sp. TDYN1]
MQRIFLALLNSMRALKHLAQHEKAVQQELALFLISLPVAFFLAPSWLAFLLMTGSILFLILVEVLNTGIEAACDAVSRDFHKEIQIAKDCGSLAVLISTIIVATVWGYILISAYFSGF